MPERASRKPFWHKALREVADPERARHYAGKLAGVAFETLPFEQARIFAALLSGSRAMSELLLAHPDWVEILGADNLKHARRRNGLRRELDSLLDSGGLSKLRDFKQREFLRIAARDLAGFGSVPQIIEEISNVADLCLEAVCRSALGDLTERLGQPYALDPASEQWSPAAFCVLGLGKLGGQELNYSSDIDLLFVYSGEGEVFKAPPGRSTKTGRGLSNQQFFARLAGSIVNECIRMTAAGFLFRVDLRLRPEGRNGPIARSLPSYETYYAQFGQTWERMMLIKARCVAGDAALGAEFLETLQPFRYPRAMSEEIPREVAAMKQRIENEVLGAENRERNVKLGRGGIREIEFLVQTLQLLHAGRFPFLQGTSTLPALDKLRDYGLIAPTEATELKEAYCFLRKLEHRLQMEDNRQTHTLPSVPEARARLARLMGFRTLSAFEKSLAAINRSVRAAYDKVVKPGGAKSEGLPASVSGNTARWREILAAHSFREPEQGVKLVQDFVEGPGFGHCSSRTIDNALHLLARFLALCPGRDGDPPPEPFLSDPDRVLTRLAVFVAAYGARATLYETWVSNTSLFRLLLLAFDRSEYLAELAIRVPDLIDQIEQSGQLRRKGSKELILADLRQGAADRDQHAWLRRYFQAEQMRIALRDILGLASAEQTQHELTELADAFLIYALEAIQRKNRLRQPPFAIIGLGKLGGRELIYASDLDVLFVAEDRTSHLAKLQKLAAELIDMLSARTDHGTTFATDTRLRPDGEKGLLVNTVGAYANYYRKRSLPWEIQALSRARAIAGRAPAIAHFETRVASLANFRKRDLQPAAFNPHWKQEIHRMRLRIEKERTPPGKDLLAIKTGRGGLIDVEFVAQALCLEHGWREPNTLAAIRRAAHEKVLSEPAASTLSENYRRLMAVERILRRWSFEPESVLPDGAEPFYRVAVRCGFHDSETFQKALGDWRAAIREEYLRVFANP